FVRPLAQALRKEHLEIWYDEISLELGDSIRRTIERGLRESRFGLVVLSKAFFAKNWTQYELDGLIDRELSGGNKVILPVWYGVSHEEVSQYSPALAGRRAATTTGDLQAVVSDILRVIK